MSPPAPVPPPADIGLWTDEELFKSLEKIILGSPLPDNVIADVNPYLYTPSNLPDGFWYIVCSEKKKDSELGFWRAKGAACEIFTNSVIIGWRTTLEFYEGQAPHGQRTNWVMQEYRITQKGLCDNKKSKDSRSLCRVFLSDGGSQDNKMPLKQSGGEIAGKNLFHSLLSTVPQTNSITGQGSIGDSLGKSRDDESHETGAVAGRLPDPLVENLPEFDYISRGDFLELDDLADPESPCSSSDNSSCLSVTSDECFDSLALLQDIEDQNQHQQGKDASLKCSVSAPVKPNEVLMCPATSGSLISGNGIKLSADTTQKSCSSLPGSAVEGKFLDKRVLEHAIRSQQGNEGMSNSRNMAASSSSHKAVWDWGKKPLVCQMKKLKKKYLCFMPF